MKTNESDVTPLTESNKNSDMPGYPVYPPSEDIYNKFHKESGINPEEISRGKEEEGNRKKGTWNEKNFDDDKTGDDLDIPGSELDDAEEKIGNEDEENNYYSLGGDNHEKLEENRSEE